MKKPKYEHTKEQLEATADCLANAKERDIIQFHRFDKANLCGYSGTFVLKNGREWHSSLKKASEARTLQQFVDEGYNLKIFGHHGDGKVAWWNNCNGDMTLLDLMEIA